MCAQTKQSGIMPTAIHTQFSFLQTSPLPLLFHKVLACNALEQSKAKHREVKAETYL